MQSWKMSTPKDVMFGGRFMVASEVQSQKALNPICVIFGRRSMATSERQSAKARLSEYLS